MSEAVGSRSRVHPPAIGRLVLAVASSAALAACTTPHGSAPAPTRPVVATHSAAPKWPTPTLTPSYAHGISNCAGTLITATTRRGTIPLADCGGNVASGSGNRSIPVKVGDQILITIEKPANFTLSAAEPANLLKRSGNLFLAVAPGRTTLMVTSFFCEGIYPQRIRTCPLVSIAAS